MKTDELTTTQPSVDVENLKRCLQSLPVQAGLDVRSHMFHFMLGVLREESHGASLTRADVRAMFFQELTETLARYEEKEGAS